jgi:hypothetical protein
MNPFDYQVSNIVYEERVGQAVYQRNLNINGTSNPISTKRSMSKREHFASWLSQTFKINSQPTTAKSATTLR